MDIINSKELQAQIHAVVKQNGLSVTIVMSPANIHDSTKLIDVMENMSDFVDNNLIKKIVSVYVDKGYDVKYIRNYLRNNGIIFALHTKRI